MTTHATPEKAFPHTLHPPTPAGTHIPAEWRKIEGPRETWQLTGAEQASYPLYYFVPSHSADGRYLVYHSERSGWVQLYRMDLQSGESVQLTEGTTREAGWEVWSESRLRGIRNHLSALNQRTNEAYYFDHDELRSVHVETLDDRCIANLGDRLSIGQTDFSPDGKLFSFIHADAAAFKQLTGDFRALRNMKVPVDFEDWRRAIPCVIAVIDTETGELRDEIECPFHVHHVLFVDNETLLINHVISDRVGMWTLNLRTKATAHLRPRTEDGAACHQVVPAGMISYETQQQIDGRNNIRLGRYEIGTNRYEEFPLVKGEFAHIGRDPANQWIVFESAQEVGLGDRHYLGMVRHAMDPQRREIVPLRELPPAKLYRQYLQRGHAHPFLDPARKWLYYTDFIGDTPQICRMEVAELAANPDFCWQADWTDPQICIPQSVL